MEPPEDPGRATITTTAAVPTSSFTSRAVEPVTLATARMRATVSRLAVSSIRLSSTNSTRLQTGRNATRLSERPRGKAYTTRTILVLARK
jgi:hypothetical protein